MFKTIKNKFKWRNPLAAAVLASAGLTTLSAAQATEIDLLLVYDDGTNDYFDGSPSTALRAMVDQTNTFYALSGVDIQLNIVGMRQLEISNSLELNQVRTNSTVTGWRDEFGADFVSYIDESFSGGCGVGYLTIGDFGAFNIVRRSCMSHSFAHEMGHNMGLGHSVAQGSSGSAYSWGIGYGVNNSFSTMMAYTSAYGVSRRTYLFSNPDVTCGNQDCGVVDVANSALALNNVKDRVADHRDSVNAPSVETVQSGKVTFSQSSSTAWSSVNFESSFSSTPAVVMGPPSYNGAHPGNIRIRNVTTNGFEYQFDEWDYLDGNHTSETVSWIAAEAGEHFWGGLSVYVGSATGVTENWQSVSFGDNMNGKGTPVVIAQKQVSDLNSSSSVRMRNSSSNGIQFKIEEEEANDNSISGETVNYIAITPGIGSINGGEIAAGLTGTSVTDSWSTISFFDESYSDPSVLGSIQTYNGSDTASLRYDNLGTSGVDFKVEEEASDDTEVAHVAEMIGWLVIGE